MQFDVVIRPRYPDENQKPDTSAFVSINGKELELDLTLVNKSPTGFSYGYSGSGPAQLAAQLLQKYFEFALLPYGYTQAQVNALALELYQNFKYYVISGLVQDKENRLTETSIMNFLRDHERPVFDELEMIRNGGVGSLSSKS